MLFLFKTYTFPIVFYLITYTFPMTFYRRSHRLVKNSWGFNTNFSFLISHTHSVLKLDNMFSATKVSISHEPTKHSVNYLPQKRMGHKGS